MRSDRTRPARMRSAGSCGPRAFCGGWPPFASARVPAVRGFGRVLPQLMCRLSTALLVHNSLLHTNQQPLEKPTTFDFYGEPSASTLHGLSFSPPSAPFYAQAPHGLVPCTVFEYYS